MTIIPLTDCCAMLGIDPKTLRHWLKLTSMQCQLGQLALELLQERSLRYELRLSALEAHLQAKLDAPASVLELEAVVKVPQPEGPSPTARRLHPAELHARSRVIPLIEYGAADTYVVICPQEGALEMVPDSPEWFEWFAALSSFRFVGQQGRFTAYRDSKHGRPSRSWRANRWIHQHNYKHSLAVTDQLTITRLEQGAAILQAHVDAL